MGLTQALDLDLATVIVHGQLLLGYQALPTISQHDAGWLHGSLVMLGPWLTRNQLTDTSLK